MSRANDNGNDNDNDATTAHLDQLVVVRLWGLLYAFEARLARDLEPLGLTLASFRLIGEVMRSPEGLGQAELARRLGVRPPTVSTAVSRLEAGGVLVRAEDPNDSRAYRIRLAPGASLDEGAKVLGDLERELLGGIGDTERAQLLAVLGRLSAALTEPAPTPP